jgi:hypothetical protein
MKLRTFLCLFFLISIALTVANHFIAGGLKKIILETEATQAEFQKISSVSQELLYSNQTTTRFARAYVSTGNQAMRDHYQDLVDILDGKIRQGCSVLLESRGFEEGVDVDGGAPSGIFDVIAAIGA